MDEKNFVFKKSMPELYLADIVKEFESFRQTGTWDVQRRHKDDTLPYEGEVMFPLMQLVGNELEYGGIEILRQVWPSQLTGQFLVRIVIPDSCRHNSYNEHNRLWSGLKKFASELLPSLEERARNSFYAVVVDGQIESNNVLAPTYTLRMKRGE